MKLKIAVTSDTHGQHRKLDVPVCDVFIHCGDFCKMGEPEEVEDFDDWLGSLPAEHKIVIAGNHDAPLAGVQLVGADRKLVQNKFFKNAFYLQDSGIEIKGARFWGTPWTPEFKDWHFMIKPRSDKSILLRKGIPNNLDVLIAHGPALGILDKNKEGLPCGCPDLLDAIKRIKPTYFVFGHIHEGAGVAQFEGIECVNAAALDGAYKFKHQPYVFEIETQETYLKK